MRPWPGARTARSLPGATPTDSGFELSFGRQPVRLNRCVRAYGPGSVRVAWKFGRQGVKIVIGDAPPIAAGFAWEIASGTDGSLAVLVEGRRVDRYEDGRLVGTTDVAPNTPAIPVGAPRTRPRQLCGTVRWLRRRRADRPGLLPRQRPADVPRPVRSVVAGRRLDRRRTTERGRVPPRRRARGDGALGRGRKPARLAQRLTANIAATPPGGSAIGSALRPVRGRQRRYASEEEPARHASSATRALATLSARTITASDAVQSTLRGGSRRPPARVCTPRLPWSPRSRRPGGRPGYLHPCGSTACAARGRSHRHGAA